MHVIAGAVNDQCRTPQLSHNAAQIREKIGANFGRDQGLTQLGAEDQVHHDIAEGLCQVSFTLSGLAPALRHDPGLAPWAALRRRFAANRLWY